jgi:hypothetical protein
LELTDHCIRANIAARLHVHGIAREQQQAAGGGDDGSTANRQNIATAAWIGA